MVGFQLGMRMKGGDATDGYTPYQPKCESIIVALLDEVEGEYGEMTITEASFSLTEGPNPDGYCDDVEQGDEFIVKIVRHPDKSEIGTDYPCSPEGLKLMSITIKDYLEAEK